MIQILTLIILFLTLVAICWYSFETRELRIWQKRQAQLSVIHMQINKIISEHTNGPDRSPGFHLGPLMKTQQEILEGERDNLKGVL